MENTLQNVAIFQFIFIDQEISPFMQAVSTFASHILLKLKSLENEGKLTTDSSSLLSSLIKKNFLFTHCFKFDVEHMKSFSNEIRTLFINDFRQFKKIISEISYRIIRGILSKKIHLRSLQQKDAIIDNIINNIIDHCQVRVSIEPFNLPFENSGFRNLNGTVSVGHHIFLTGRVTNIDQPKRIIIRRLYKCKNPSCRNIFYLHINDTGSSSSADSSFLETNFFSVYCEKCGELASEDETGRIMASYQKFSISPTSLTSNVSFNDSQNNLFFSDFITNYKYFTFFPQIELKIKDFSKMNNYQYSESLMVGKVIDVIGTSIKHNARIICEPNFTFPDSSDDKCGQTDNSREYFVQFLTKIEHFFPGSKTYKSFHRIAAAALCAVSSSSQLLFVVKTAEDMKILVQFLVKSVLEPEDCDVYLPNEKSLIKGNLQNFAKQQQKNERQDTNYSSQPQPPGLLSKKSVIIYHLETISTKNQEKLKRIISQKSVSGCKLVPMTIIGILVSKEFDNSQISLFDSFPMIVRVESFSQKLFIDLYIDSNEYNLFSRTENEESFLLQIRQEFKQTTINEEGQTLIDRYIEYIDKNSNLNETQIENATVNYISNESMIKFANSGLNISPESISNVARAIATIRGDSIATEYDVVLSIYFFEERITALNGHDKNELSQFPPTTDSFFCAGISAVPTKDEGVLYSCYCSILNKIIED